MDLNNHCFKFIDDYIKIKYYYININANRYQKNHII